MITATEVRVLDIRVGETPLGLFKIVDEWNGFKKMESLSGRGILIAAPKEPEGMANCFDNLFSGITGVPIVRGMNVVSASPELALLIKKGFGNDS